MVALVKMAFEQRSHMNPKDAYASAAQIRFSPEPPFSDVLTGIAAVTKEVVSNQKKSLPTFEYAAFAGGQIGEPKSASDLRLFIFSVERVIAFVDWWKTNRQAFRNA